MLNQVNPEQNKCLKKTIFSKNYEALKAEKDQEVRLKDEQIRLSNYIRKILKKKQNINIYEGFRCLKSNRRLEGYSMDVQETQHQCFSYFNSALQNARSLKSLDISGMDIDPLLAIEIGQAIQKNSSLHEINLSGCKLNSSSLQYIFSSISNNQTLQSINLFNNQGFTYDLINDISQYVFGGKNCLKKLKLTHCNISSTAMSCLLRNLKYSKTITQLDLSMMEFTTDVLTSLGIALQHYKGQNVLEYLNIGYSNIRDQGLEVLFQRVSWNWRKINIKELILRRNFITQQGIPHLESFLQQIKQLQRLDLSFNEIEELTCQNLLSRQLYEINLSSNHFYQFPQKFFMNSLIINLSNNNIEREGAFQLSSILRQNPLWVELNLSNNNLKSEGFNSIIFGLRDNHFLKKLIVAQNNIDGEGFFVYMINHEQVNFEYLDVSFNKIRYQLIFFILSQMKNGQLKSLKCENMDQQTNTNPLNEQLKGQIRRNFILFNEQNNNTEEFDPQQLEQFQLSSYHLRELYFSKNLYIFTPVISSLANYYNKIEILDLSSCKPINPQDIDLLSIVLRKSTFMHTLNISNLGLGYLPPDSLIKLRKSILISSLKSLSMSRNQLFSADKIFEPQEMIVNFKLERLDLSHNRFSSKHFLYIEKILSSYQNLKDLDLSYNNIDFSGIIMLVKYSKENQSLKHLNLSNQKLRADDLILISQIISNQNLISLNLSNNNSVKRMKTFFSLCSSKKQEILHLDHIDFDKLNFQNCVEVIKKQKRNINGVIIDYCNFRKNRYEKLSLELIKCKKLQLLSMNYNPFIYLDLDKAAYLLNETKKLKILEFSQITFTGKSFSLVAEWLQNEESCQIQTMKVSESAFKQEWFDELSAGFAKNKTLKNLIFDKCNLGALNFFEFGKGIAQNSNLKVISLESNNISDNLNNFKKGIAETKNNLRLKRFNLANNPIIQPLLINYEDNNEHSQGNIQIDEIDLSNCHLKSFILHQKIPNNILPYNTVLQNTISLCLSNNYLNDHHCEMIIQFLSFSKYLEYLYIQQNEISSVGMNKLLKKILKIQNFKLLDVSKNLLDDEFAYFFHETAKQDINLQFLHLRGNHFTAKGQKYLSAVLKQQRFLFIDNIWSQVDDEDGEFILQQYTKVSQNFRLDQQSLPQNVKEIMIIKSNLTDKFCKSFGKYYPLLNFIEIIDISDNPYITMYGKTYLFFHLFDLSFEKHNLKAMYITNSKDYRNLYDDGVLRYLTLKFRNFLIPYNTNIKQTLLQSKNDEELLGGMVGSWILHKVNKILFYLDLIQPPVFIVSTLFMGKFRRNNKALKILMGFYLFVFSILNLIQFRNIVRQDFEDLRRCTLEQILQNNCDHIITDTLGSFGYSIICVMIIFFFDLSQLIFIVFLRRKIKPALQIVYPRILEKLQSKKPTKRELVLMLVSIFKKFETLPERMFLPLLLSINLDENYMNRYQILFSFFIILRGIDQFIAALINYVQFFRANPRDDQANYLSLLQRNLFIMNFQVPSEILASFCPIIGYQIKNSIKISSLVMIDFYRMICFDIPLFVMIWRFIALNEISDVSTFSLSNPSEFKIWIGLFFLKCIISIVVSTISILTLRPAVVKQHGFNQALAIKRFYQNKQKFVKPQDLKIEETINLFIQKCQNILELIVMNKKDMNLKGLKYEKYFELGMQEILEDDENALGANKSDSEISISSSNVDEDEDNPQSPLKSSNHKFKYRI